MRTSESIKSLTAALLAAQKQIDRVIKDQTGKIVTKTGGSYEYKYANLASVLDEIKDHLNENGVLLLQSPSADEKGITVTTRLLHESTEWIEDSLFMPVTMGTPQAYGAAIAYARRYQLQSLLGLKSVDEDAAGPPNKNRPNTAKQVAVDEFEKMDEDEKKFITDRSIAVIAYCEQGHPALAHDYIEREKLDAEQRLALWSLLPSDVRSTLKQVARASNETKGKA